MAIKAEEISSVIRQKLEGVENKLENKEVGYVLTVGDGIARIDGLNNAMAGELLAFPNDVVGMVLNLEEGNVGVALLGNEHLIKEGDTVKRTGTIMSVPVGEALVGRVLNALGQPIDGKGALLHTVENRIVEIKAPGIIAAQVGARADADRAQGDRLDDPDRPWPARADHRRPPDRQDRHRDRHDHQPEGAEHDLRLRGDRPEAVDRRPRSSRRLRSARGDGLHHRGRGHRLRVRAACSSLPPTPA